MDKAPKKRISQAQIAKEVGCSQALVSMALNGRTKGISEKTYNLIRELAFQQGYTPRGMKIEESDADIRSKTVGYILRSPLKLANKSNFFSHIHQGLHELLGEERIKTIYLGSEDDLGNSKLPLNGHLPDSVRAIAIMGQVDPLFLAKVKKLNRPLVYISARATGQCHSVLSNEYESASLLVDHLYELGHRNFAFIGGCQPSGRFEDRLNSMKIALAERELELDPRFVVSTAAADRNEGYDAAESIHQTVGEKKDLPTAWISLNALMARGAINYLFQNGVKVGTDVSVAAFDMTRVCEEERPSISSAGADPESMGREAARILLQAMEREPESLSDLTLPAKFVKRETTGPVPTKPRQVKKSA